MKKLLYFFGGILTCVLLVAVTAVIIAQIDIQNAQPTDKYTEQDVKDTSASMDDFWAKKISEIYDAKSGVTIVYDVPKVLLDGTDYKVVREEYTATYTAGDLDDCMDTGMDKTSCIEEGKSSIAWQVHSMKEDAMRQLQEIQNELNDVDYTGQFKDGDFTMTEEELNAIEQ